tara:strand:+ start:166 stop:336 length:171 start_codon:yes stop_codon:yes gene_type:complete
METKDFINASMNALSQLHYTPDEELSELGKMNKKWFELNGGYEKVMETFREYRNEV